MEPITVGDHPALDLLNTVVAVEGEAVDAWQSDAEVLRWLRLVGLGNGRGEAGWKRSALLTAARSLRETARELVQRKKSAKPLDAGALNRFLVRGSSHLELVKGGGAGWSAVRVYESGTPEQVLAPLAEAVASLVAEGDFELVRRCEGPGCILWFYDRTKAHRRRWCSMAACGNRYKVAAFRERRLEGLS